MLESEIILTFRLYNDQVEDCMLSRLFEFNFKIRFIGIPCGNLVDTNKFQINSSL